MIDLLAFYVADAKQAGLLPAIILGMYHNCGLLNFRVSSNPVIINGKGYCREPLVDVIARLGNLFAENEIVSAYQALAEKGRLDVVFENTCVYVRWADR